MKTYLLFLKLALLLLFQTTATGCDGLEYTHVCFQNKCIDAEVRSTSAGRIIGLLNYSYLEDERGMLFVFDKPGRHRLWMKDMKFPVDMVWIDSQMNIVEIVKNVQPCYDIDCPRYGGTYDSLYAVEVRDGFCEEFDVTVGQTVLIGDQDVRFRISTMASNKAY